GTSDQVPENLPRETGASVISRNSLRKKASAKRDGDPAVLHRRRRPQSLLFTDGPSCQLRFMRGCDSECDWTASVMRPGTECAHKMPTLSFSPALAELLPSMPQRNRARQTRSRSRRHTPSEPVKCSFKTAGH